MSSLVTTTLPKEGEHEEADYGFNFDRWIVENELESVKQILIQHKATTPCTLSFDATEFQTVLMDAQLFVMVHMVPKLTKAVHRLQEVVNDDEKEVDRTSLSTENIRNSSQFLKEEEKAYNPLHRSKRRGKVLTTQNILKNNMDRIKRQITANNELMTHSDSIGKGNIRTKLTKYIHKLGKIKNIDTEDDAMVINRLENTIRELETDQFTQQKRIHELEKKLQNICADQQRAVVQLKESLSFSGNKNSQRFVWLQCSHNEKKENDIELAKIVAENPIRIAFVDGKRQCNANDVLSLAPPVHSIDAICKCNQQILNAVKILMKDVDDSRHFIYQFDFDTNGICYAFATHFGTKQWHNPMEDGAITVDSLHGWYTGEAKQVLARKVNCGNCTKNKENGYIRICFNNGSVQPTAYTWRHDTCRGGYPRNWDFEGSNDDVTWDVLKRHENDTEHGINSPEASH
eukprot:83482_1